MTRILGPTGSGRRRRTVFGAFVAFLLLSLLIIPNAFAVHDLDFQLDADVNASTTTSIGGHTQTLDWDSVFTVAGANVNPLPTGITAAKFVKDFNQTASGGFSTTDSTTYATGSKDTLPITPGWQCNRDSNVNSKIDIMNAYAAAYTAPNGDEILYFALERNTNTGDANVGFWFLQGEVSCDSPGGNTPFTGDHVDGDLLIVSAFTNGGNVSTIDAYRWNGGANGSLGTTPVAHGVDCRDAATGTNDPVCAVSNRVNITTPWLTATKQDGVGHTLRTSDFFEGGLNLTQKGLSGKCFNTFTGVTRSSQSLTATLFDFALGQLGECLSTTETTPSITGSAPIEADGTVDVSDTANVTVTGGAASDFDGTVTFHLCGPFASGTTTLCETGGVDAGSDTVSDSDLVAVSDTMTVTSVGRYCFRGEFVDTSGSGIPPSHDSSDGECFEITPLTPTLATQAGEDSPVDLGQPVTDTATLTGTAHQPGSGGPAGSTDGSINPTTPGDPAGGTITFTLLKDDCSTLATGTGTNPQTLPVSGDGSYGPVSFTPDAPGDYHWVASYDGDAPNTLGTDHNLDCTDSNEDVTVRQVPTAISTAQNVIPNDSATISSTVAGVDLPTGGEVIFTLYGPGGGNDALANCLAGGATGLLYTEPTQALTGGSETETVDTSNTTVSVDASDVYYWRVTYDPKNSGFVGVQSNCTESTDVTFTNDVGPGTTFP
jgi:hypothetical protein